MRVLTLLASLSHMSPLAMRRSRDRPRLLGLYLLSPSGLAAVRVETNWQYSCNSDTARGYQGKTIPVTSSMKLEAFLIPGLYLFG